MSLTCGDGLTGNCCCKHFDGYAVATKHECKVFVETKGIKTCTECKKKYSVESGKEMTQKLG